MNEMDDETWNAEIRRPLRELWEALAGREKVVSAVSAILFDADPVGINFESNTDEYDAEALTIVLRSAEAASPDTMHLLVYEEFCHWFGNAAGTWGRYRDPSEAVWEILEQERAAG